jgi:hypothetical protein
MIADKLREYDGFDGLPGGQDGGRLASLIGRDQCARADNLIFRGGAPTTRPGVPKIPVTFSSQVFYYKPDGTAGVQADTGAVGSEAAFQIGLFQGAQAYSAGGVECIIASIGGRLFQVKIKHATATVDEVKLERRNRSTIPMAYMLQADRFFIVQDNEGKPIIFDGVTARRAGKDEIFTGSIMAYGMGRITLIRGREIYFGDIFDGSGKGAEDLLKFTETSFLNEGFPSSLPSFMGKPTGAAFYPQQDTATGTGELLVFGENGAESFFLSLPRERWKDSPFQRTALIDVGALGHRAIVTVNSDLWFRSVDGWRSYRQARAEANEWAQIPLSTAVRDYTEADTQRLLEYGSAISFNNRLHGTCTPQPNQGKLYHEGLLSLDFDVISSFGRTRDPAWDGHWSTVRVLQIVKGRFGGRERAFVFALDANNQNAIYELTKNEVRDESGAIPWELDTRSMDFDSEFNEKKLYSGDLWIEDVREPVTIKVSYRPDQVPEFAEWQTLKPIAPAGQCGAVTCGICPTIRSGYYPRKRLSKPKVECDPVTSRELTRGFEFQTRISGIGHCSVRKLRIHARALAENGKADCK